MSSQSPEPTSHTAALFEALSKTSTRNNGKRKNNLNNSDPMAPYARAARWFPLGIDPFADLRLVLFDGMEAEFTAKAREAGGENEMNREPLGPEELARRKYHLELYKDFASLVPGFSNIVSRFEENPDLMERFVSQLADQANQARSDDIHSLRTHGILYILPGNFELATGFTPPFSRKGSKSLRGFNHPQTARMLCPQNALEEFDSHPDAFMDGVNDGKIKLKSGEMPAFLYNTDEDEYDVDARHIGLLRGETLVRVYRHIFTGPSTAATGISSKATKACKSKIHRLTKTTPKTIAYAAVMGRFMMSSVETWNKRDGSVNLETFWKNIVRLFERADLYGLEDWASETLAWFDRQVPGLRNNPIGSDPESDAEEGNDDMDAMFRAAARKRLQQDDSEVNTTRATDDEMDRQSDRESLRSPQRTASEQVPNNIEHRSVSPDPWPPRHRHQGAPTASILTNPPPSQSTKKSAAKKKPTAPSPASQSATRSSNRQSKSKSIAKPGSKTFVPLIPIASTSRMACA